MSRKKWLSKISPVFMLTIFQFGIASTKYMNDSAVKQILDSIFDDYEKRLRPNYTGEPLNVGVDLTILRFGKVDALKMTFEVDMFFRQVWFDHRLRHNLGRTITLTCGNAHPAATAWVPDTAFINSVTSSMHSVTVKNHKLDIKETGEMFWGTRVTISPNCQLDLRSYPMDTQTCRFEVVSYAHSARDLIYYWKSKPGIKIMDPQMAQFQMVSFTTKAELIHFVAGSYTVLTATFVFKRLKGHSIIQVFIPSFIMVCVSWFSLWIDRKATPARIALCITTLLTVATIWGAANSQLPRVNYIKAIDVYLMISFCMVLLTLMEYIIVLNTEHIEVNFRKRRWRSSKEVEVEEVLLKSTRVAAALQEQHAATIRMNGDNSWSRNRTAKLSDPGPGPTHYSNGFPIVTSVVLTPKKKEKEKVCVADIVEKTARVILPMTYLTFNCIYWVNYMYPA